MKELKFRAWDKKNKVMYVPYLNEFNNINEEIHNLQEEGVVLIQYTGLNDKNDVEIYEGDVLKVYNDKSRFYNDIAKVVFHNGAFMLKSIDFEDEHIELFINHPFSLYSQENYEVVGNIYENKELLK